ncbi:MAG: geranylgeranylglycerol-phosphate geranylgeranyltransferase [Thermoplasmata archaeon]
MHPALRILRPGNVLVAFVGTWVGGLAVLGRGFSPSSTSLLFLLLASVSTGLVVAGGNVLNDLGDEATDRRNHPDRPLVTGGISRARARVLGAGLFVTSVLVVLPLLPSRPIVGLLLAAAMGAVFGYELWAKSRGVSGNLLVAFLTGAVFLYGGASVGDPVLLLPLALMAFAATLSREIIKDMEDAPGDTDRRTLPRTRGLAVAARAARGSALAAILLSPLPLLYLVPLPSIAAIIYLALVLGTDALFVVSVRWLPDRLHVEQGMSKLAMTVALGAFLATAFR